MAYKSENLTALGNTAKRGVKPALWIFYNEGGDAVTTAGFLPITCGVANKDKVMVITTTASAEPAWYYATISSGVITLAACS